MSPKLPLQRKRVYVRDVQRELMQVSERLQEARVHIDDLYARWESHLENYHGIDFSPRPSLWRRFTLLFKQ